MESDNIKFVCDQCGGRDFRIPHDPKPDDVVTCVGCGASANYADVQAKALEAGKKLYTDRWKNLFKK